MRESEARTSYPEGVCDHLNSERFLRDNQVLFLKRFRGISQTPCGENVDLVEVYAILVDRGLVERDPRLVIRWKHLVIICPYLKINDKLRRTIEVADRKGVNIFVIYGKRELDAETMSWLKGLRNSNIANIPQLHAKLYMNEGMAVISSMNLYEFSQVNNEELGVLCGKRQDRVEFKDITFQVMRLIGISEKEHGKWETGDLDKPIRGLFKRGKNNGEFRTYDQGSEDTMEGSEIESGEATLYTEPENILCHCIRCGRIIPSTHDYVYCGRCMDSWQRYSNMRYVEQDGHCYICGKPYKASAEKPACIDCYASHAELVISKCEAMRKA